MLQIIHNFISKQEIDQILDEVLPLVSEKNMVYFAETEDFKIKKTSCIAHPTVQKILSRLPIDKEHVVIAGLLSYPVGAFNKMHMDNCIINDGEIQQITPWTHTGIIYLNSNFTGGELNYPNQNFSFKPETGALVLAPAGHEYPHEVTPVSGNERYALVIRFVVPNS